VKLLVNDNRFIQLGVAIKDGIGGIEKQGRYFEVNSTYYQAATVKMVVILSKTIGLSPSIFYLYLLFSITLVL